MGVPSGSLALISSRRPGKFFKGLHEARILGVVARPGGDVSEAELHEQTAHGRLVHGDAELLPHTLHQVFPPPPHHAVHRRDRSRLDDLSQGRLLARIELWRLAGRLAIDQARSSFRVETQNPVPHRLKPDTTDLCRLRPQSTVQDRRNRKQTTTLARIPRCLRSLPNLIRRNITPKLNCRRHGKPPVLFAMVNHINGDSAIRSRESRTTHDGITSRFAVLPSTSAHRGPADKIDR